MTRTILVPAALAGLLALLSVSHVHAYGAAHVGYTTSGPGGVQHYGATAGAYGGSVQHSGSTVATPYGTEHTGTTTATGPNGGTYTGTTTRAYSPAAYSGYSAAGYGGGYPQGVTRAGVYP
jgi:hypothetical protein